MHRGYVKIFRKIDEWEWYRDSHTLHLFLHLLLKANYKETRFRGHVIPMGSCVVGLHALRAQTKISVRSLRTALEHLKLTRNIVVKSTNRFSIVSIVNYESYQQKPTNNRQTTDKQPTTSKEVKNEKNEKNNTGSSTFSKTDTDDIKSTISKVTGWDVASEAVKVEARIIEETVSGKKQIKRPVAYAVAMAKKLRGAK